MLLFTLPAPALVGALSNVLPHASTDDLLPVLKAVRFTVTDTTVRLDATDRYTLGEQTVELPDDTDSHDGEVLLGLADVKLLLAMAKTAAKSRAVEPVTVGFDGETVTFSADWSGASQRTRPVEGAFPQAQNLWPTGKPAGTDVVGLGTFNIAKMTAVHDEHGAKIKHAAWRVEMHTALKPSVWTPATDAVTGLRVLVVPVRLA